MTGELWCILLKCTWACFARITDSWAGFSDSRHSVVKVYAVIIWKIGIVGRDVECMEMGILFFVGTTASIPKSTEPLSVYLVAYESHLRMFGQSEEVGSEVLKISMSSISDPGGIFVQLRFWGGGKF